MKCSSVLSLFALVTAASAAPSFITQYENDGVASFKSSRGGNSIVDRLREDKRFSRFVEVLERERGLKDDLEREKATVFIPTNDAFDKWEQKSGGNKWELKDVLRYHVAGEAEITSDCLHAGALIPTDLRLKTLGDRHQRIRVFKFGDRTWLNMYASIVDSDIKADNGIIHAIDHILMPPMDANEMMGVVPTKFSTFKLALHRTGLSKEVCRGKDLTIFSPTNAAWEQLGLDNLRYLFSCVGQETEKRRGSSGSSEEPWCKGTETLKEIVESHIAKQVAYSTDIMEKKTMELETYGDEKITVCAKKRGGEEKKSGHHDVRKYNFVLSNGEARIQFHDLLASNAVVHAIDNVMVPCGVKLPNDRMMQM